jgi:hypothetical protein
MFDNNCIRCWSTGTRGLYNCRATLAPSVETLSDGTMTAFLTVAGSSRTSVYEKALLTGLRTFPCRSHFLDRKPWPGLTSDCYSALIEEAQLLLRRRV